MVMIEQEIFSSFVNIIEEVTGIPASKVTHEADITDELGISSLSLVEIIVAAEDQFNVEIPDEALGELRTVRDVVRYVQRGQRAAEVAAT